MAERSNSSFESDAIGTQERLTRAGTDFGDIAKRFASQTSRIGSQFVDRMGDLPALSREWGGRIDRHARSNPWVHIGFVGLGALALGYALGRRMAEPTGVVTGLKDEYADLEVDD